MSRLGSTRTVLRWATIGPVAAALAGCLPHPPPPPAPYHAIGSTGQWHLVIDDKHVTFLPVGGQPIREAKHPAIPGSYGEYYRTGRINVNIVHGSCVANGRTFPDRVQVRVDGAQYEGCGGL